MNEHDKTRPASSAQLAVFGGEPRFEEVKHVGRPNIGDREAFLARMRGVLDSMWLTNDGPLVREFEARIADTLGVRNCITMCNGTVALEIAIRALGLQGEVIVPAFTFVATAHALQWQEITPVFCDVDPTTHVIDPGRIERHITPRTTGILGVHIWGFPCDTAALEVIAERNDLRLLFDAAHAFGCLHRGTPIGNFGDAAVLSFHATKFLNAFEGGAVVTNDDALAERIKLMRNFGFVDFDQVTYLGTNGKMAEPAAAMGLTNLDALDEFVEHNRQVFDRYRRVLEGLPGVRLVEPASLNGWNYQYVVLDVNAEAAGLTRDELVAVLWAENVRARRYFYPGVHRMEPYRSVYPHSHLLLPETERLVRRTMVLPTGTSVSVEDADVIGGILAQALDGAGEVRRALERREVHT